MRSSPVQHLKSSVPLFIAGLSKRFTKRASKAERSLHRAGFLRSKLQARIDQAPARSSGFAILLLELCSYQKITFSLGSAAGRKISSEMGRRIEDILRNSEQDVMARFGRDRFGILVDSISTEEDALSVAAMTSHLLEKPMEYRGQQMCIAVSVGVVFCAPQCDPSAEKLLLDAEMALEEAKSRRRAERVLFTEPLRSEILGRFQLESDLRLAVQGRQFFLVYQPKVNTKTGEIIGFEALCRWQHAKRGAVPPSSFIPLAEDTGLISDIGRFVLTEAVAQLGRWRDQGLVDEHSTMAVNISPDQLRAGAIFDVVQDLLKTAGVPPHCLILEITESTLMLDAPSVMAELMRLHESGIGLDLDDFGTGYSSLSYLHRFPFRSIKIDRSFVERLSGNQNHVRLVDSIIQIAKCLDMQVVAEGVETREQASILQELGCTTAQGYYFFKPMVLNDLNAVLQGVPC